jgi:hypothetical protein
MSTELLPGARPSSQPQQAVWPWLLVPLITLAVFFTLRSFREMTAQTLPASSISVEQEDGAAVEPSSP